MDPADLEWGGSRWASFLEGSDPTYPMDSLAEDVTPNAHLHTAFARAEFRRLFAV